MSENPIPHNAIIAKNVQPAGNGVVINGQLFPSLSFERSIEMHETAIQIDAPVCHTEGESIVCFIAPKLGRLVKDPDRTKALLEDIAINALATMEQHNVPREFLEKQLGSQITRIDDIYSQLTSKEGRNEARHKVIHYLKRTSELIPDGALNNVVFDASMAKGS